MEWGATSCCPSPPCRWVIKEEDPVGDKLGEIGKMYERKRVQHHAEMRKKRSTKMPSVGAEPTGRRKANLRRWVQHHAEMRKKRSTKMPSVGAEPAGRRKANLRRWVQRHAGGCSTMLPPHAARCA